MNSFTAEFIGTAVLLVLGNGVVANVILNQTKGNSGGWIVITFGWGMAVFVAVFMVGTYSGAHLNPAVTLALAIAGVFEWAKVPGYILAQLLGGALGASMVWFFYRQHYQATADATIKLATFATIPAIRSYRHNFFSEAFGTFIFILAVLFIAQPEIKAHELSEATFGLGALGALPVGFLVFSIGLSLGGTTGYAINPARDLGPRLMHALLPISGKGSSDWAYAWIPVVGPMLGGSLAGVTYWFLK